MPVTGYPGRVQLWIGIGIGLPAAVMIVSLIAALNLVAAVILNFRIKVTGYTYQVYILMLDNVHAYY